MKTWVAWERRDVIDARAVPLMGVSKVELLSVLRCLDMIFISVSNSWNEDVFFFFFSI